MTVKGSTWWMITVFQATYVAVQRCSSAATFGDACTSDTDCSAYDQTCSQATSKCVCRDGFYVYGSTKLCTVAEPVQNIDQETVVNISVINGVARKLYSLKFSLSEKTGNNADVKVAGIVVRMYNEETGLCIFRQHGTCKTCQGPNFVDDSCVNKSSRIDESLFSMNNKDKRYSYQLLELPEDTKLTASVSVVKNNHEGVPSNFSFTSGSFRIRPLLKHASVNVVPLRNLVTEEVSLNVSWVPGAYTGPYSYYTVVEYTTNPRIKITDGAPGNVSFLLLDNLRAYRNYTISVWSCLYDSSISDHRFNFNKKVEGVVLLTCRPTEDFMAGPATVVNVTTLALPPGQVTSFSVVKDSYDASELMITFQCPTEKNGPINGFLVRKTHNQISEDFVVPSHACNKKLTASDVGGVRVSNNYSFEVMGMAEEFNGTFTDKIHIQITPKRPLINRFASPPLDAVSSSQHSMQVSVCSQCLVDDSQGTITEVGLLVCPRSSYRSCYDMRDEAVTWAQAKAEDFKRSYWASPLDWLQELKKTPILNYPYTIGSVSDCSTDGNSSDRCNGPLPADRYFTLCVVACNSVGCTGFSVDHDTLKFLHERNDGLNRGAIAGLVLGCFVGLVFVLP